MTLKSVFLLFAALMAAACGTSSPTSLPPNIVWIVLDDASPAIGVYGNDWAVTPNLDRLAREGTRFSRAFATSPGCAPSRSALVSGIHASTMGSHHMRSVLAEPPPLFTSLLREAGYFVVWPGKMDFNFYSDGMSVDPANLRVGLPYRCAECFDSLEPWLGTEPPSEPFFAYYDVAVVHESQVRADATLHEQNVARLAPGERQDPAAMTVPAYLPDVPEARQDLARFYELMTAADYQIGDVLAWLDEHDLTDRTAVFVLSDHGTGLPRMKRWLYDSGLQVPLIVRWPGEVPAGAVRDDLASLVDLAPTALRMAGLTPPDRMQGRVLVGPGREPAPPYVYGARDRWDETPEHIRSARDGEFLYIRNFRPELPYAQRIAYAETGNTMRAWRSLHDAGALTGPPALFFAPKKPAEELYAVAADPDQVRNLAGGPQHADVLARMRLALDRWIADSGDKGQIDEAELLATGVLVEPAGILAGQAAAGAAQVVRRP